MEVIRDNPVQYKGSFYLPKKKDEIVKASSAHSIRSGPFQDKKKSK